MKNVLIIEIKSFVHIISSRVPVISGNQLLGKQRCSLSRSLPQSQDPCTPAACSPAQLRQADTAREGALDQPKQFNNLGNCLPWDWGNTQASDKKAGSGIVVGVSLISKPLDFLSDQQAEFYF